MIDFLYSSEWRGRSFPIILTYKNFTMYVKYFGFKEKPFTIAPDPRYLYMSEQHREALAHLLYGVSEDGCFILLTGDVGTGKTTVCRSLLEQLPENTQSAIIINPKLSVFELLETICEELTIPFTHDNASIKSYIDAINNFLLYSHAQGKTTILIIDEAQNLDMDVLEQLRLLTNLETNTSKLLKIILIGQPELQQNLRSDRVAQISQRITSRYHLAPLNRNDTYNFIRHRLIIAGGGRMQFFSKAALKRAYLLTNGIPRLINILCDRALLGAYIEGSDQVSEKILLKAGWEILGRDSHLVQRPSSRAFPLAIVSAFILLLLGTTALFMYRDNLPFTAKVTGFFNEQPVESPAKQHGDAGSTPAPPDKEMRTEAEKEAP